MRAALNEQVPAVLDIIAKVCIRCPALCFGPLAYVVFDAQHRPLVTGRVWRCARLGWRRSRRGSSSASPLRMWHPPTHTHTHTLL